ncbi:Hypothetical_protein [Hexamita inflata]|uniref:Hypothetical_protein n=1 Tax=Hexamita inflata TaxID=28002 RepID=A0AA86UEK3_9EUKA|nr:Hypothetical protein HINF_LOCUS36646 [Hexamita inflata]
MQRWSSLNISRTTLQPHEIRSSSSMKKSFKQNNQSSRSQKQTEHNKKNKQNNQSNTEQSKPKGSQQNQSKKNQIKELVKSFNKILNGNQKPKGNSFTGQQNHNSSTKQRATSDQNPYIYIKQCEMNNCFDRKQQNKINDAYKKNWKKHSWNQADVVQKLTKVLQKTLKQQGNYFDRNNNKFNNNQGKLFNSLSEYRYDDVKSKRNDDSFIRQNTNRLDQLQQAKQRRKQVVWRLQVRKLQPNIHMRSQAAVLLTKQLLSELAP